MMTALQTLVDNGASDFAIIALLNDIIAEDSFEKDDDKRCCIALLYEREQGTHDDPDCYSVESAINIIYTPSAEYLVLDDDEADAACREYIKDSLWAFNPSFLAGETGIDQSVFEALASQCEDANPALRSIINGSCGFDDFVKTAISTDGRGHFLSMYDGEECELSVNGAEYYLNRTN